MQTEMAGAPETAAILEALKADRATARERQSALERQIREEARRLRSADGTGLLGFQLLPSCVGCA